MKSTTRIISIAAAMLLVGGGLSAFFYRQSTMTVHRMERRLSLTDLVKESDLVVEGTLLSKSTHIESTETAGKLVYTDWTVQPNHVLKGTVPNPLIISVLGGEQGSVRVSVAENAFPLRVQEQYLMFVEYTAEGNRWDLSALRQSLFRDVNGVYKNAAGDSYRATDIWSELAKYPVLTPSLKELVGQSELIVYGTLAKSTLVSHPATNGETRPYTLWTIQSPIAWKGTVTGPLAVSVLGGQLGTSWYPYEVRADLRNGLAALMFLRKDGTTDEWRLVSSDHGFFLLNGETYHDIHGTGYSDSEIRSVIEQSGQ